MMMMQNQSVSHLHVALSYIYLVVDPILFFFFFYLGGGSNLIHVYVKSEAAAAAVARYNNAQR